MPTVIPLVQGSLTTPPTEHDGSNGQMVLVYKVTGLTPGQDARLLPEIPQRGDTRTIDGIAYAFDRSAAEPVFDGEANVKVFFSTDGRFRFIERPAPPDPDVKEWNVFFQPRGVRIPFLIREPREFHRQQNDGTTLPESRLVWVNKPFEKVVEDAILTRTVHLFDLTDTEMRDLNGRIIYPIGDLHNFTLANLPGFYEYWEYKAPTITMRQPGNAAGGGSMSVTYTWRSDPGNGAFGIRSPNLNTPGAMYGTPPRPPFYHYEVAAINDSGPPLEQVQILLVDEFPFNNPDGTPNPYVDPDGWMSLPGNPLG